MGGGQIKRSLKGINQLQGEDLIWILFKTQINKYS